MPDHQRLHMREPQRLLEQRVVVQIDLADRQIVRRPPIPIDPREQIRGERDSASVRAAGPPSTPWGPTPGQPTSSLAADCSARERIRLAAGSRTTNERGMAPSGIVNRSLGKSGGVARPRRVGRPHLMPFATDSTPNANAADAAGAWRGRQPRRSPRQREASGRFEAAESRPRSYGNVDAEGADEGVRRVERRGPAAQLNDRAMAREAARAVTDRISAEPTEIGRS